MDLPRIQSELARAGIDGWLFYDFHNRDRIAYRILGLDENRHASRRWFYWLPAAGEPVKLAHKVEPDFIDALPGRKELYLSWRELHELLNATLGEPGRRVAMQYSPLAAIPAISIADAGTVDLIRSFGHEVVSSADLVQTFEAVMDDAGLRSHREASETVYRIKTEAFERIERSLRDGEPVDEYGMQQFIVGRFTEEGLTNDGDDPIVAVNDHPANPHYIPTPASSRPIQRGDTLLIDLWARHDRVGAIYCDITWCGFVGREPPAKYVEIFHTVRDARDAAVAFVRERFSRGEPCHGFEVDDACREVVQTRGYGEWFIHRTGHSIGVTGHGNGVNIDNLESKDDRSLVPGVCFSIEPGIYLPGEMAVRSEIDVVITPLGEVEVSGESQHELITMDL